MTIAAAANVKGDTYTSLPTGPKGTALEKRENALLNISPEQFVQAKEGSFTSDYRMGKVLGEGRPPVISKVLTAKSVWFLTRRPSLCEQ